MVGPSSVVEAFTFPTSSPTTPSALVGTREVSGGLSLGGGFGGKTSPAAFGGGGSTSTTGGFAIFGGVGGGGQPQVGFDGKPFGTSASSPFGNTSGFGVQPVGTGGGIFGEPSTGFGSPTSIAAFGTPPPQPQPPAPSSVGGGIFGGGTPTLPAFGLASGGISVSTGAFGQQPTTMTGTGNPPFQPFKVEEQVLDRYKNTKIENHYMQSITAMNQYQAKSFEDLRFEDYQKNNKHGEYITKNGITQIYMSTDTYFQYILFIHSPTSKLYQYKAGR